MTPKEKATELISRFYYTGIDEYNCRQCALIAVDEILNNFGISVEDKTHYCSYSTIQYFQEVKQELEKL